jgi:hypothetical protein
VKLYDYTRAPNPRRVRIFLAEKGITVPTVQLDLFQGAHLTPEDRRGRLRTRRPAAFCRSTAALHHTTHSNGSQVWKSGIQACDFIQWHHYTDQGYSSPKASNPPSSPVRPRASTKI